MGSLSRLKLQKISTVAIISCMILSALFAGFTIYGNEVGNVSVDLDKKHKVNIALSEYEDKSKPTSRLFAPGLSEQDLATLDDIPSNITQGMGSKNDVHKRYLAYSFYIINFSDRPVDFIFTAAITEATKNVDAALRLMVLEEDFPTSVIYAKPQANGLPEDFPYLTVPFIDDKTVMQNTFVNFGVDKAIKFTVVIWLEGWDDQADDSIQLSQFKINLHFLAY